MLGVAGENPRPPALSDNPVMWYRTEFDFNVLFIHLRTRKMPFNSPIFYFTLQSRIKLDTCYSFIKFGTGFATASLNLFRGTQKLFSLKYLNFYSLRKARNFYMTVPVV